MFKVKEKYRVLVGAMASSAQMGNNGIFVIPHPKIKHATLFCIACDQGVNPGSQPWEHVSVSVRSPKMIFNRCPIWEEMCFVKDEFWDKEDCCVQYHPAESEYVNCHKYCLHIWRPVGLVFPTPDKYMVGDPNAIINK